MNEPLIPTKIWELAQVLRRRGISIGVDDYAALQQSLRAGFGWGSRAEFLDLCSSLWAKSLADRKVLAEVFDRILPIEEWDYSLPKVEIDKPEDPPTNDEVESTKTEPSGSTPLPNPKILEPEEQKEQNLTTEKSPGGIPEIDFEVVEMPTRRFVFAPQFPLTDREVAQTWRQLSRRVDDGTQTELDLPATIDRWSRSGVLTELLLRPRRRNMAKLLILVDRQGSMAPFHGFCEHVCRSIAESSYSRETAIYYFHNILAEGADEDVLQPLAGQLFPALDPILDEIEPCWEGDIYTDRDLLEPIALEKVLELHGGDSSVVIISDAGAARNSYAVSRLLETIAFMKALRTYTPRYVWLNPLAESYWRDKNNTAGQIARHIPMFSLDREGMERSVQVLRGQEYPIEKSI